MRYIFCFDGPQSVLKLMCPTRRSGEIDPEECTLRLYIPQHRNWVVICGFVIFGLISCIGLVLVKNCDKAGIEGIIMDAV